MSYELTIACNRITQHGVGTIFREGKYIDALGLGNISPTLIDVIIWDYICLRNSFHACSETIYANVGEFVDGEVRVWPEQSSSGG